MSEHICRYKKEQIVASDSSVVSSESKFKNFKIWMVVLLVYMALFGYIGYIAFWPMAFNNPEETVEKYYKIVDKYITKIENQEDSMHFRTTLTELVKESESEADDMQQLASQSFNIVLGAFLAFLSATVTTIFQSRGS